MKKIEIYSDGACRGNPGPGGWGALLRYGDREKRLYGSEKLTTNNRMELKATIEALRALREPCDVTVWTDSQYVKKGMTEWLSGWKAKGWKTAAREPVKNADLWQELEREALRHRVDWQWVKGHAGHEGNEEADRLANQAIDEMLEIAS
ncbi:ribonuclease HI [Fluviicoccus keumensis]|uniref:Ribonuclease H n=1 Tax=Fluviicoccus keumensis TaxID=1435465 RepID=A0A4V2G3H4_9GAMM|nr:ribonuclease HI [Fluviicoccus keumensis]RZU37096.1 ribonuclease HI [Fluviicoccus keumensis]